MKGGFHFFTRSQRIAIVALLVLVVVVIALDLTIEHWASAPTSFIDTTFVAEVRAFEEEMERAKAEQHQWQHHSYSHEYVERHRNYAETPVEEFDFDPNTLDSVGFVRLGLKPWMASNICKYRERGGVFRKKSDLQKIYGLDSMTYLRLEPYIQLPNEIVVENVVPDILVELNTVDTTVLFQLTKHSIARGIVGYRNLLGGYATIEQLKEVHGMTDEQYDVLSTHATIDVKRIRKMKVNKSSVEYLKHHPYINFYQAKAIYELRIALKRISSVDDLKGLEEFTPSELERVVPYLDFE